MNGRRALHRRRIAHDVTMEGMGLTNESVRCKRRNHLSASNTAIARALSGTPKGAARHSGHRATPDPGKAAAWRPLLQVIAGRAGSVNSGDAEYGQDIGSCGRAGYAPVVGSTATRRPVRTNSFLPSVLAEAICGSPESASSTKSLRDTCCGRRCRWRAPQGMRPTGAELLF